MTDFKFTASDFRFKRSYHDQDWDYENILLTISNLANAKIAPLMTELEELRVLAKDHLRGALDMALTFDEIDRIKAAALKYGWKWEPERIDPESPWRKLELENERLKEMNAYLMKNTLPMTVHNEKLRVENARCQERIEQLEEELDALKNLEN